MIRLLGGGAAGVFGGIAAIGGLVVLGLCVYTVGAMLIAAISAFGAA